MSSNTCANCGKEGSDVTNTCNKCKEVMYCNAACKKKHRHKHKKQCERRVAELHDQLLFKQPPRLEEDCPICFLRMPRIGFGQAYMACCGKTICRGCTHAVQIGEAGPPLCPFCRTPLPNREDVVERYKKRVDINDPIAIGTLGGFYDRGLHGLPQNMAKALKLYHRAGELGHPLAYYNIGNAYRNGRGVDRSMTMAIHYTEVAAMCGVVDARRNLGVGEYRRGQLERAVKHYMIATEGGSKACLEGIKQLYAVGHATKDDYAKALRSYQAYLDDIKSVQRDAAAAANADYKYHE